MAIISQLSITTLSVIITDFVQKTRTKKESKRAKTHPTWRSYVKEEQSKIKSNRAKFKSGKEEALLTLYKKNKYINK